MLPIWRNKVLKSEIQKSRYGNKVVARGALSASSGPCTRRSASLFFSQKLFISPTNPAPEFARRPVSQGTQRIAFGLNKPPPFGRSPGQVSMYKSRCCLLYLSEAHGNVSDLLCTYFQHPTRLINQFLIN